jgi:hypothetical protein
VIPTSFSSGELQGSFLIWPNPATGSFQLSCPAGTSRVELLASDGRLIFVKESNQHRFPTEEISVAGLANGLYQVVVVHKSGLRQVNRLMVQN